MTMSKDAKQKSALTQSSSGEAWGLAPCVLLSSIDVPEKRAQALVDRDRTGAHGGECQALWAGGKEARADQTFHPHLGHLSAAVELRHILGQERVPRKPEQEIRRHAAERRSE